MSNLQRAVHIVISPRISLDHRFARDGRVRTGICRHCANRTDTVRQGTLHRLPRERIPRLLCLPAAEVVLGTGLDNKAAVIIIDRGVHRGKTRIRTPNDTAGNTAAAVAVILRYTDGGNRKRGKERAVLIWKDVSRTYRRERMHRERRYVSPKAVAARLRGKVYEVITVIIHHLAKLRTVGKLRAEDIAKGTA